MSQCKEATLDTQGLYDVVMSAHSALMDRIIDQIERGLVPSEADLHEELQLRVKLDQAVAARAWR